MDDLNTPSAGGFSRRDFLKTGGALIVAFSLPLPFDIAEAAEETKGRWPAKVPDDQLDSWLAVNQAGSVTASVGMVEVGMGIGSALRKAAAEARMALLELASPRLNAPVEQLRVKDGVVYVQGDVNRKVSYSELIGGQRFNVKMSGKAKSKNPEEYTVVGKPVPRVDIPPKVTAQYQYLVDLKLPGMLHGRI